MHGGPVSGFDYGTQLQRNSQYSRQKCIWQCANGRYGAARRNMRAICRGVLVRGGGVRLKQREPQTDHRHVDTYVTVKRA